MRPAVHDKDAILRPRPTCVLSRVEYDCKTDSCVGFVLPLNDEGPPEIDSVLAISFRSIKEMFQNHTKACVYMAQSLDQSIPAFCLACLGTDNKFTAEHVLMRWNSNKKGNTDYKLWWKWRLTINESYETFGIIVHFELQQNPVQIPSVWLLDKETKPCLCTSKMLYTLQ